MIRWFIKLVPKWILLRIKKIKPKKIMTQVPYFDGNYYLENNIDILVARINPLHHFLKSGQFEGRDPARTISADWIQYKYSKEYENPFEALLSSAKTPKELSPNPLFDPEFYLSQIGDPSELLDMSSYEHFLTMGVEKGFKPNRWLNLEAFAISNPWFFSSTKSNFEKFVNLFEIVRRNEFFNNYLCFTAENLQGKKIQITSEIFDQYLHQTGKWPKKSASHNLSGWQVIDLINEMSKDNFLDLIKLDSIKNYPPKIIDFEVIDKESEISNVVFYCHWSINGKVAEWVGKTLNAFNSLGFKVAFNTNLDLSSVPESIRSYCSILIRRSQSGHDFESHLLTKEIVLKHVPKLQRLILANDSFFFPVSDISRLTQTFENPPSNFWGLTENLWAKPHLQSYFLVLEGEVISKYFDVIEMRMNEWEFISKAGLINNFELASHEIAAQMGENTECLFRAVDPTFDYWDVIQDFGVPIVKVHLLRKLLAYAPGDGDLLEMKLSRTFEGSQIQVSEMLDHCREVETLSPSSSIWYNNR